MCAKGKKNKLLIYRNRLSIVVADSLVVVIRRLAKAAVSRRNTAVGTHCTQFRIERDSRANQFGVEHIAPSRAHSPMKEQPFESANGIRTYCHRRVHLIRLPFTIRTEFLIESPAYYLSYSINDQAESSSIV